MTDNLYIMVSTDYDYVNDSGVPSIYDRRTDFIFPVTLKTRSMYEFHNFLRGFTMVLKRNLSTGMLDLSKLYYREEVLTEIV